jgi:hypothetical protein
METIPISCNKEVDIKKVFKGKIAIKKVGEVFLFVTNI